MIRPRSALRLAGGLVLVVAGVVVLSIILTNDERDRGGAALAGLLLLFGVRLLGWHPARPADAPGAEEMAQPPLVQEVTTPSPLRLLRGIGRFFWNGDGRSITSWYDALLFRIFVGIIVLVGVMKLLTLVF